MDAGESLVTAASLLMGVPGASATPHPGNPESGWKMLQRFGLNLGLRLLFSGNWIYALRYLLIPVNYWRALEYRIVWNEAGIQHGDRVLDIGSPKLMSLYLAKSLGIHVHATDIEDYFIEEYEVLRRVMRVSSETYHLEVEDGRKLRFDDEVFDKIYSISVLEHVPDDGDSACAHEMGRVLAPGGRCVITVPFSERSRDEYKKGGFYWTGSSRPGEDGSIFYQRRYSEPDLFNRIIRPSGLKLIKLAFYGEKIMNRSRWEFYQLLPVFTGPIQPLLSKCFHTGEYGDWKALKKPLCAVMVLEKPGLPAEEGISHST